jgi:sporulation protein YlmC with PRC-barrel domain
VRLSDLLGAETVTLDGRSIGRVRDVRFVQDGHPIGTWGAAFRLDSVVVGVSAVGVRLGFARSDMRGPWMLKAFFARRHARLQEVRWAGVAAIEPNRLTVRVGTATPTHGVGPHDERPAGRTIDAGLALLDRQILDPDGWMSGNVDDLELTFGEDGVPWISAILVGPGALARRVGGRLGRWIAAWHARLQDRHLERPARISFGIVADIGQDVRVSVPFSSLPTASFETWVRDHIVDHLPGS